MLYYDKIDISEGIDVNKTNEYNCHICHYICNRCHDLLMMSMNLSNINMLKSKNADYRCIISGIIKNEAINLLQNIGLTERSGIL